VSSGGQARRDDGRRQPLIRTPPGLPSTHAARIKIHAILWGPSSDLAGVVAVARDLPQALTARQRWVLGAAALLTAVSRWFALARTPWDWDEHRSCLARPLQRRGAPPAPARFSAVHPDGENRSQIRLRRFPRLAGGSLVASIAIVHGDVFSAASAHALLDLGVRRDAPRVLSERMVLRRRCAQRCAVDDAGDRRAQAAVSRDAAARTLVSSRRDCARDLGGIPSAESSIGFLPFVAASVFARKSVLRVVAAYGAIARSSRSATSGLRCLPDGARIGALHEHQAYITRVDSFLSRRARRCGACSTTSS
jgi:hypothetical protein